MWTPDLDWIHFSGGVHCQSALVYNYYYYYCNRYLLTYHHHYH